MSSSFVAIKVITKDGKTYTTEFNSGYVEINVDAHDGTFRIEDDYFGNINTIADIFDKIYDWFFESLADTACGYEEMEEAFRIYGSGNLAEIRSLKLDNISYISVFTREEFWDEPFGASLVAYDYSTKAFDEEHRDKYEYMDEEDGFGEKLYERFSLESKVSVSADVAGIGNLNQPESNILVDRPEIGDKVLFGGSNWSIIALDAEKALLLADKSVGEKPYNRQCKEVTWGTCTLRNWLNKDFYKKLSDIERSVIVEVENENPMSVETGVYGGEKTKDKVFILSIEEINKYLPNNTDRANGEYWRTRTPGGELRQALVIRPDGSMLKEEDCWVEFGYGIRPVVWIKYSEM